MGCGDVALRCTIGLDRGARVDPVLHQYLHQLGLVHLPALYDETENAREKSSFPKLRRLDPDKCAVRVCRRREARARD